jgi:MtN3 and saliva related transmembrane protein
VRAIFPDVVGWVASAVLFATLFRQVWTQIRKRSASGVSHWLFIGQMVASVLFLIYSILLRNWVFSVSNAVLLVTAIVGQWVSLRARSTVQQGVDQRSATHHSQSGQTCARLDAARSDQGAVLECPDQRRRGGALMLVM